MNRAQRNQRDRMLIYESRLLLAVERFHLTDPDLPWTVDLTARTARPILPPSPRLMVLLASAADFGGYYWLAHFNLEATPPYVDCIAWPSSEYPGRFMGGPNFGRP